MRHSAAGRVIERRVDRKGLRPRVAAGVIAVLWLIAVVLMIGGLSFFAVVTGVITSVFVTRAQAERRAQEADPVAQALERLTAEVGEMRDLLARIGNGGPRPPPG